MFGPKKCLKMFCNYDSHQVNRLAVEMQSALTENIETSSLPSRSHKSTQKGRNAIDYCAAGKFNPFNVNASILLQFYSTIFFFVTNNINISKFLFYNICAKGTVVAALHPFQTQWHKNNLIEEVKLSITDVIHGIPSNKSGF